MKIWISEKVRCDLKSKVACGFGSKSVKGSLQESFFSYCKAHDVSIQRGRPVVQSTLDRSLRELGVGPEQGVTAIVDKPGWLYAGLTLNPRKGEKIEFLEPEVVSKLR